MQTLFLVCDRCHFEIEVEPLETFGYRGSISCKNCGAELVFQNSELKARDAADRPGPLQFDPKLREKLKLS
jgi:hypothetical protein